MRNGRHKPCSSIVYKSGQTSNRRGPVGRICELARAVFFDDVPLFMHPMFLVGPADDRPFRTFGMVLNVVENTTKAIACPPGERAVDKV